MEGLSPYELLLLAAYTAIDDDKRTLCDSILEHAYVAGSLLIIFMGNVGDDAQNLLKFAAAISGD